MIEVIFTQYGTITKNCDPLAYLLFLLIRLLFHLGLLETSPKTQLYFRL